MSLLAIFLFSSACYSASSSHGFPYPRVESQTSNLQKARGKPGISSHKSVHYIDKHHLAGFAVTENC